MCCWRQINIRFQNPVINNRYLLATHRLAWRLRWRQLEQSGAWRAAAAAQLYHDTTRLRDVLQRTQPNCAHNRCWQSVRSLYVGRHRGCSVYRVRTLSRPRPPVTDAVGALNLTARCLYTAIITCCLVVVTSRYPQWCACRAGQRQRGCHVVRAQMQDRQGASRGIRQPYKRYFKSSYHHYTCGRFRSRSGNCYVKRYTA